MDTNSTSSYQLHIKQYTMNHTYDSQLKIIKDYYKNTIQYHRHNHTDTIHSLSLYPKKISRLDILENFPMVLN